MPAIHSPVNHSHPHGPLSTMSVLNDPIDHLSNAFHDRIPFPPSPHTPVPTLIGLPSLDASNSFHSDRSLDSAHSLKSLDSFDVGPLFNFKYTPSLSCPLHSACWLAELPEDIFSLIVSRTGNESATCKSLHLVCQALRTLICSNIDKISLPSSQVSLRTTHSLFRSLTQLRVTCATDPSDPADTPTVVTLPPAVTRLVIRTGVCCPKNDTVPALIRASSRISCLTLTRTHSLKNNVTADAHLQSIVDHCTTNLRALTISGLSISPHAAHTLSELKGLTYLDVKDAKPCEAHSALNAFYTTLQSMTALKSLVAEVKSAAHMSAIATLTSLTSLDLRPLTPSCKSSHSLASLGPLSSLHTLTLRKFHSTHLAAIASSTCLTSLHLLDCEIVDEDLRAIAFLTNLAKLSIDACTFATAPAGTVFGGFTHDLTALRPSLRHLHINTVPRFSVPLQVLTTLDGLTTLRVDRTNIPSTPLAPIAPPEVPGHPSQSLPLLTHLEELADHHLVAGCKELDILGGLPSLKSLEVGQINEGIRARSVDPIVTHTPIPSLTALTIVEQPLVWRPDSMEPRWPVILANATPNLKRLSIKLYGASCDADLVSLVDNLPGLTSLTLRGEFGKGLMALTQLSGLKELSVLAHKGGAEEVVTDVGVALSRMGLTKLCCQHSKSVARAMVERGRWGCVVHSAGKW